LIAKNADAVISASDAGINTAPSIQSPSEMASRVSLSAYTVRMPPTNAVANRTCEIACVCAQ
jgi:hypothetical protein